MPRRATPIADRGRPTGDRERRPRRVHPLALVALALLLACPTLVKLRAPSGVDRGLVFEVGITTDIGAPEGGDPVHPFPENDRPRVRLAVAGDVGTGGQREWQTAAAMARLDDVQAYDALVLLGDNAYPNGDPARLTPAVFDPFHQVLDAGSALLAVLGNHDVRDGNAERQVEALGMPGRWYARHIGPVLLVALDSTDPDDPEQLRWLERTLASASEPWRIVALHHPPYSAGRHGSSRDVRAAFEDLFRRHGVQLVLAGHDHDYQRSVPIDGVTYVVSGGAATLRRTGREDFTAVSWSDYHFLDIAIWADRLQLRAVGQDGLVHDQFELAPRPARGGGSHRCDRRVG